MVTTIKTTKPRRITTALFDNDNDKENFDDHDNDNDNKFKIVTSGILSYRINILNRLQAKSKENASTIIVYLFSMHNEINPSISYKTNQIMTLSQLSESCNNQKPFSQMTRDDILAYLNNCRKSEEIDPLHKWIGTYNTRRIYLLRFFKWLYNPDIEPDKRPTPQRIIGDIPQFKRKEKSIYKPTDLWKYWLVIYHSWVQTIKLTLVH